MAYLLIFLVLVGNSWKGYCGKKVSNDTKTKADTLLFNSLRMLFCVLIGLILVFVEGSQKSLKLDSGMFWICLLSGIANAAFMVGWLLAVQKNTMVTVSVGLTVGSLLPAVLCALFFNEKIVLPKMIGFALIIAATAVLADRSKKNKGGSIGGILLMMFSALGEGMSSFAQQLYKQFYTDVGMYASGLYYTKTVFHFYTFIFSGVVLFAALIGYHIMNSKKTGQNSMDLRAMFAVSPSIALNIFIMAACLFAVNYLQTLVTGDFGMQAQLLYPTIKGGNLIMISVVAMIFFGEKVTLRTVIGLLIALAGIVFMGVL